MIALGISFLTGRSVATDMTRDIAEWPPHPDRIFMAMVAAWGETSLRHDAHARRVLECLEAAEPPCFSLPKAHELKTRSHFVPVNGKKYFSDGDRKKRKRDFHSVVPASGESLYVVWPDLNIDLKLKEALKQICDRMAYIGHSSSPVSVTLVESHPPLNLVPRPTSGMQTLRVPYKGRLAELVSLYETGRRPTPKRWVRYSSPEMSESKSILRGNMAGELIILRRKAGDQITLPATLTLTRALRGSFLKHLAHPSGFLSGHEEDGAPLRSPHPVFLPLSNVGHRHGDGRILGVGVLCPMVAKEEETSLCLATLAQVVQNPLFLGSAGMWEVEPQDGLPTAQSLDPLRWRGPSRSWATVTPVVLDRYPKKEGDVAQSLKEACNRAGLPVPEVALGVPVSPLQGVPHAREFPSYQYKPHSPKRWHTHAIITFPEEVEGPVVLGAGRFFGYGLCLPVRVA